MRARASVCVRFCMACSSYACVRVILVSLPELSESATRNGRSERADGVWRNPRWMTRTAAQEAIDALVPPNLGREASPRADERGPVCPGTDVGYGSGLVAACHSKMWALSRRRCGRCPGADVGAIPAQMWAVAAVQALIAIRSAIADGTAESRASLEHSREDIVVTIHAGEQRIQALQVFAARRASSRRLPVVPVSTWWLAGAPQPRHRGDATRRV